MKSFAVLSIVALCFVAVVHGADLTDEQKAELKQHRDSCVTEIGIDQAVVDQFRDGQDVTDEKVNCFSACLLKKIAILNEDGTIDKDVAHAKIIADDVHTVYQTCTADVGKDACETGGKLLTCLIKANVKSILV